MARSSAAEALLDLPGRLRGRRGTQQLLSPLPPAGACACCGLAVAARTQQIVEWDRDAEALAWLQAPAHCASPSHARVQHAVVHPSKTVSRDSGLRARRSDCSHPSNQLWCWGAAAHGLAMSRTLPLRSSSDSLERA